MVSIGIAIFWPILDKAHQNIDQVADTLLDNHNIKATQILDRNGKVLYEYRSERREFVPYEKIPVVVRNAIVAAEDRRFFSHPGVDVIAAVRQVLVNGKEGKIRGGASTIPMQLAKLTTSESEKTMERKLSDMAYALELERSYTKEDILEMYMNRVYFGAHAFGVSAAARTYFNKSLNQLSLSEAATLARCVRRPSDQNPFANLEVAERNRNVVLQIMLEENMITQDAYDKAREEKLKVSNQARNMRELKAAPYFVNHVLDVLKRNYPDVDLKQSGYRIETTLDLDMQKMAEEETRRVIRRFRGSGVTTGAFVLMNRSGEILAEIGGADFNRTQYNAAYQGKRQPGSSFKAFVYATGLAKGIINLNSILSNEAVTYPGGPGREPYSPKNAEGTSGGSMDVVRAFALSYNLPAVDLCNQVGPSEVVRYAQDVFGFQSDLAPYLSLALGSSAVSPIEMAQGYSVFMLHGNRATPFTIKRIVKPDGEVLAENEPRIVAEVLDPVVCNQMETLLRAVVTSGTGTAANVVPNAYGKTGTTNDHRDAWFCGYSNGLLGVSWIASEQIRAGKSPRYLPMSRSAWGGSVSAPFWAAIMKKAGARYGTKFAVSGSEQPISAEGKNSKPEPAVVAPEKRNDNQDEDVTVPGGDNTDAGTDAAPAVEKTEEQTKKKEKPKKPKQNLDTEDSGGTDIPVDTPTDEPPAQPKPERRPAERMKTEFVDVEICTRTGRRATMYCPETLRRRFKKGEEPAKSCTVHH